MDWLDPRTDPIDLDTIYIIDVDSGRYRHPADYDPVDMWAVVIYRSPRGRLRVVIARPTMAALGAALGAEGLLSDARILGQLRRLQWRCSAGERIDRDVPPPGAVAPFVAKVA